MKDLPGNLLAPVMDTTDFADMLSYISDFAESLELETTYGPGGNHPVTAACQKASLLLRRAEAILKPLAEAIAEPDEDTAIEATDLCNRCHQYPIFDRASKLCSRCSWETDDEITAADPAPVLED